MKLNSLWCFLIKFIMMAVSIFAITACDNLYFNELFRNPYKVDIGVIDSVSAYEWYVFETEFEAPNKKHVITIEFLGSQPSEFDIQARELNEAINPSKSLFYSTRFPGKSIEFEVLVVDIYGAEYTFRPTGRSSGIRFISDENGALRGAKFNSVKIKANLDLDDIKVSWISSTGK